MAEKKVVPGRGVPDSFRTRITNETKDGMDIDPEGELPHSEPVPAAVPQAAPVAAPLTAPLTAPTTAPVTAPTMLSSQPSQNRRRSIPFALLGIMTIGTGLAAFFAVQESTTPSDAVASAVTNSLGFKTAAITTTIRVKESGGTATIISKGVTNFDTGASTQVMRIVSGNAANQ